MESPNSRRLALDSNLSSTAGSPSSGWSWTWLIAALLLLGGGAGFVVWRMRSAGGPPGFMGMGQAIPVELATLDSETIRESSTFLGVLEAEQGVVLRPEADGRITQIYVTAGTLVTPGDPIVQLSPDRPQAQVNAAEANTTAAQAALTTAEAQLRAATAEQQRAEADLRLQAEELSRTTYLVTEGAQSQQQLDLATRNRDTAQASVNAARDQVAAARSAVDQARAALNQASASASATREDLQDTLVAAPIAGTVGDIPVKLGEYVQAGDNLTTITQNQTLELDLAIPVEERPRLRTGLQVELLAPGSNEVLGTGSISFISPQVNPETQAVLVKAQFPNSRGLLQDALRVEARLIWAERPGVLVPSVAISRLGEQAFVFVAQEEGCGGDPPAGGAAAAPEASGNGAPPANQPTLFACQRAITLGGVQGNDYQVLEGLETGETIVVSGILNLTNEAPIQPLDESQSAPPGAPPSADPG